MANCGSLAGLTLGCRAPGGLRKAYIGVYPSGYTGVNWFSETTGTIESISGVTVYEYELNNDSSTATFNPMGSKENGTFYTDQTVTLVFSRMDVTSRNQVMLLGQHPKLLIFVLDSDGTYWMFGETKGMTMIDSGGGTGTAPGDLRGYSLVFQSNEDNQPKVVESAVIAGIIG